MTAGAKRQREEHVTVKEQLGQALSGSSLSCFNSNFSEIKFKVGPLHMNPSGVQNFEMAVIMLANSGMRMILKTHFRSDIVEEILLEDHQRPKNTITKNFSVDFMKEFNNQLGGTIKSQLAAAGIDVALSLPFTTRGFDNYQSYDRRVPSDKESTRHEWMHSWRLSTEVCNIDCTAEIEVIDEGLLDAIGSLRADDTSKGAVLEML